MLEFHANDYDLMSFLWAFAQLDGDETWISFEIHDGQIFLKGGDTDGDSVTLNLGFVHSMVPRAPIVLPHWVVQFLRHCPTPELYLELEPAHRLATVWIKGGQLTLRLQFMMEEE